MAFSTSLLSFWTALTSFLRSLPFFFLSVDDFASCNGLDSMTVGSGVVGLADGPDEGHRMVVGRNELRRYMEQQEVNATFRDG